MISKFLLILLTCAVFQTAHAYTYNCSGLVKNIFPDSRIVIWEMKVVTNKTVDPSTNSIEIDDFYSGEFHGDLGSYLTDFDASSKDGIYSGTLQVLKNEVRGYPETIEIIAKLTDLRIEQVISLSGILKCE